MSAGGSTANVSFGDTVAQNATLTISGPGSAGGPVLVTMNPPAGSQVVLPATNTTTASTSSNDGVHVSLKVRFNNLVTPTSGTPVSLASDGAACFTASRESTFQITSATIPASTGTVTVYFGDPTA